MYESYIIEWKSSCKGNTYLALEEMAKVFETQGIESEIVQVGNQGVRGCMACGYCHDHGKCVIQDVVNDLAQKFEQCDGLVVGTPVYYGSANGNLISALDRLFYSTSFDKNESGSQCCGCSSWWF